MRGILLLIIKNIKGVICYDSHQARYKFVPLDLYHANAGDGGWSGFELNVNRRLPEVVATSMKTQSY